MTTAALFSGSKCYFFSGAQYIRVTRGDVGAGTVDAGYPKNISTWGWGSFGRNGFDAALYSRSKCYFFSGDQYIRVTRGEVGAGKVDAGYPKSISTWGWGSFGRNGIDAALYSRSKCYFFSGDQYIRVTRGDVGAGTVDAGYPKSISTWGWGSFGRNGIDAALYSRSKCYFFSGDQYIRVTRGDVGAGTVDAGYPKNISTWGWGEVSFAVSECIFGWTARFTRTATGVDVRIRLAPNFPIPQPALNALMTTWQNGIVATWDNQFPCDSGGANLTANVLWVNANEHHLVTVQRGPARSDMTTWDDQDTGAVAAHEFGHMLGLPDEYVEARCPDRDPVRTGTVMDNNTGGAARRHIEAVCQRSFLWSP